MAESVETRISTFENNSKKKTVNRNSSLYSLQLTVPILSEEEKKGNSTNSTINSFWYGREPNQHSINLE